MGDPLARNAISVAAGTHPLRLSSMAVRFRERQLPKLGPAGLVPACRRQSARNEYLVLETSNTAPSTFSFNESRHVLSAFICVHRRPTQLISIDPQELYSRRCTPINADFRGNTVSICSVQLILGHYTSGRPRACAPGCLLRS